MVQLLVGNPLAMAVGNTVMDIVSNKKFLNNVKNLSKYFFLNLNKIKKKISKVLLRNKRKRFINWNTVTYRSNKFY